MTTCRDDLHGQLKDLKAQLSEQSAISKRLQSEVGILAREKEDQARSLRLDKGTEAWNGHVMSMKSLDNRQTTQTPTGQEHRESYSAGEMGLEASEESEKQQPTQPTQVQIPLVAMAELQKRHTIGSARDKAEITELRGELDEACTRVQQLSDQERLLKATLRELEEEIKAERELSTGDSSTLNVAYLKTALVR
ncbi:unnamed protein product [Discosporangium mesarthrocarpum]